MKKSEFLAQLRARLEDLPASDRQQSLDYYSEMIDDRMEEGLLEEEAVRAVGTPAAISEEIHREMPLSKLVKARVKSRKKLSASAITLIILGFPLWFTLLAAAFVIVLSVYLVIWSLVITLHAIGVTFAGTAIGSIFMIIRMILQGEPGAVLSLLGCGLFLAGASVFVFLGCKYAVKGVLFISKKMLLLIKLCFVRKEISQ